MPSLLTVDAVAALEDVFLRGEWTQALTDSRNILAARMVQLQQEESSTVTNMTVEEERVLSVYLQAVFELDLDDEIETAITITKAFAPLPSGVVIQWSSFLVAMNRRPMATQALRDLLECYSVDGGVNFSAEQYAKAAEVLALQLLLPDEGIDVARQFVAGDNVLDDGVKLQLLRQIQAAHLAAQEATKNDQTSARNQTAPHQSGVVAEQQSNDVSDQSLSTGFTGSPQQTTKQEDDSSCYVMIGGTAIALAVAAAGALRYREKIQACVSNAIPAISKGLSDAKYALFEA